MLNFFIINHPFNFSNANITAVVIPLLIEYISKKRQLMANVKTYEESKPLDENEMAVILGIADEMIKNTTVPCTGCHYCVAKCPKKLDIPQLLKLYNEAMVAGSGLFIAPMALAKIDKDKQPNCCISCHSCEKVCPQNIHIPDELAKFAHRMGQ